MTLGWVRAIYLTCLVAVVGAVAARLAPARRSTRPGTPQRDLTAPRVDTRSEMAGAHR